MGAYKIYNGTTWVDICDCNLRVLNHASNWRQIDPKKCKVKYFDGSNWCSVLCPLTCEDLELSVEATETTITATVISTSYANYPENLTLVLSLNNVVEDTEIITITDVNTPVSFTFTGLTGGLIYEVLLITADETKCEPVEIRTGDPN